MPKKALVLTCTEEDRATLDRWIRSRTIEARLVDRAKIIMKCIQGQRVLQIAKDLKIRPNTVIDWRRRFHRGGIAGLHDLPWSGKPPIYGQEFRDKVLEPLEQSPPAGQAVWDGPAVAEQKVEERFAAELNFVRTELITDNSQKPIWTKEQIEKVMQKWDEETKYVRNYHHLFWVSRYVEKSELLETAIGRRRLSQYYHH